MSKRVSLNDRINDDKKMAKVVSAYTSTNKNKNIDNDSINNDDDDDDVNVNVNNDVNIDSDIDVYEIIDNDTYENDNINNIVNDEVNINANKFVIEKQEKVDTTKRATYYLLPQTIKKIEKLSKATGVGKSALVQRLLDQALDLVEIK